MKTFTGRLILTTLCFVWALAATVPAQADQTGGFLTVTATINGSCIVTDGNLNFGNHTAINAAIVVDGTFGVNCTGSSTGAGMPYTVDLGNGMNPTAGNTARQMANAGNLLEYQLYREAARTSVWGAGMAGGSTKPGTGMGFNETWTVYGTIPAQPTPPDGFYSDEVTITVAF